MNKTYTIQEMSAMTELPSSTLRYYERVGIIMPISRTSGGHRIYTDKDYEWIEFVKCMQKTNMPLDELRRFCELHYHQHDLPARLDIIKDHARRIEAELQRLKNTLTFLDQKIERFESRISKQRGAYIDEEAHTRQK